MLLAEMIVVDP